MNNSLKIEKEVLERLRKVVGRNSDKELADLLGLKQGNFSARKQRGSLIPVIAEWAIQTRIDLNWLLRGELKEKRQPDEFLQKVEAWKRELAEKDARFPSWFEYQFDKKFPEFKTWREEKEGKVETSEIDPLSKVA